MHSTHLLAAFLMLSTTFAAATGSSQRLQARPADQDLASRATCQPKCTLHQTCTTNSRCIFQGRNCNLTEYEGDQHSHSYDLPDKKYMLYYAGAGYSLDYNNPGHDFSYSDKNATFDGALTPCAAAQKCSDFSRGTNPDIYHSQWSFALYYRYSLKKWQCVGYGYSNNRQSEGGAGNDPPSFWNVPDKDVEVAYGYSFPSPYDD